MNKGLELGGFLHVTIACCRMTVFIINSLPGKFDYIGSSHQCWHVIVVIAFLWWHRAGQQLFEYRQLHPCESWSLDSFVPHSTLQHGMFVPMVAALVGLASSKPQVFEVSLKSYWKVHTTSACGQCIECCLNFNDITTLANHLVHWRFLTEACSKGIFHYFSVLCYAKLSLR